MDASDLTERRRNAMVYIFHRDKPASKKDETGATTYSFYNQRRVGAVEVGIVEIPLIPEYDLQYGLDTLVFDGLTSVLKHTATLNLGPTRSSRHNYIWFASIAQALAWVRPTSPTSEGVDGWSWDTHYVLHSETSICVWMNRVLQAIQPTFTTFYDAEGQLELERRKYGWTELEQQTAAAEILKNGRWNIWFAAWQAWYTNRTADGATAAAIPPTADELPNGATALNVAGMQDPATFPHPESWTPLKIGEKTQKYLTYNWQDVRSSCLTTEDTATIAAAANTEYPSTGVRTTEIGEVVSITNTLTDTQKVIAEFWAGGPFTVSPPGMFLWMWRTFSKAYGVFSKYGMDKLVYSGLDLATHLFETGRVVWGLKKEHMQARPIQEIRRLYRGQTLKKYDGTDIDGMNWVPYQETNFVTPPFSDFPSGHSAFSRSFANVMNDWFGISIPETMPIDMTDLYLLSPVFDVPQLTEFGTFVFPALKSQIQIGVIPAVPIQLSFSSWNDMAEQAGISRKYGGIHAASAHTGSVLAADSLHTLLRIRYGIHPT